MAFRGSYEKDDKSDAKFIAERLRNQGEEVSLRTIETWTEEYYGGIKKEKEFKRRILELGL